MTLIRERDLPDRQWQCRQKGLCETYRALLQAISVRTALRPLIEPATKSQTCYHYSNSLPTVKRVTTVPTVYWQSSVLPLCQRSTDSQACYHSANSLPTVKRVTTVPTVYRQSNVLPLCHHSTDRKRGTTLPTVYWQSKVSPLCQTG